MNAFIALQLHFFESTAPTKCTLQMVAFPPPTNADVRFQTLHGSFALCIYLPRVLFCRGKIQNKELNGLCIILSSPHPSKKINERTILSSKGILKKSRIEKEVQRIKAV